MIKKHIGTKEKNVEDKTITREQSRKLQIEAACKVEFEYWKTDFLGYKPWSWELFCEKEPDRAEAYRGRVEAMLDAAEQAAWHPIAQAPIPNVDLLGLCDNGEVQLLRYVKDNIHLNGATGWVEAYTLKCAYNPFRFRYLPTPPQEQTQ